MPLQAMHLTQFITLVMTSPINLIGFVKTIEYELGIEVKKNLREMHPGDIYQTYAEVNDLFDATGYKSQVTVENGVAVLVEWYKVLYQT